MGVAVQGLGTGVYRNEKQLMVLPLPQGITVVPSSVAPKKMNGVPSLALSH